MPYFISDGTKIFYEFKNYKKNNKMFLFLHGLGGSSKQAQKYFSDIPEDITMLYMDLRCNGKSYYSKNNELSFERHAKDIKNLLDYLKIDKVILGGISMGAASSIRFTIDNPSRVIKLILIRSAWINKPMNNRLIKQYKIMYDYMNKYDDINKGKKEYLKTDNYLNNIDIYPENKNSNKNAFDYKYAKETSYKYLVMPKDKPINNLKELNKIKCETLILTNRFDPPHPYTISKLLHHNIKNSIMYIIPSRNIDKDKHYELINKYINNFIK